MIMYTFCVGDTGDRGDRGPTTRGVKGEPGAPGLPGKDTSHKSIIRLHAHSIIMKATVITTVLTQYAPSLYMLSYNMVS